MTGSESRAGAELKPRNDRPDLVPLLALFGVVLLLLAGWWLFPRLQRVVAREDCIAAGYTNCDGGTY